MAKEFKNFRMELPESAHTIIHNLQKNGYEAYAVGGCVRDAVLGKQPHDYDICSSATPEQAKEAFQKDNYNTYDTGIQHGTITVVINHGLYEITTFRSEGKYTDGRHPDSVKFITDIETDLARRDFTINAMAYKPYAGIIDPFGGMEDCERKLIRCVGDPNQRFQEDGLRIMRAIRFAATYGFEIEENTKRAIHENKELLRNVSAERKTAEFVKILVKADAKLLMEYSDIFAEFIPEIKPMIGFNQKSPWHLYDVYEHTARAVAMAPNDPTIRLALFFHDIGKPKTFTEEWGRGHFRFHDEEGQKMVYKIMRDMKFDVTSINDVSTLVRYHDTPFIHNTEPKNVKSFLRDIGEKNLRRLITMQLCDQQAQRGTKEYLENKDDKTMEEWKIIDHLGILETYDDIITKVLESGEPYRIKDLAINGNDLIQMGIPAGEDIGDTLRGLLLDVIVDPSINVKDELLSRAHDYWMYIAGPDGFEKPDEQDIGDNR